MFYLKYTQRDRVLDMLNHSKTVELVHPNGECERFTRHTYPLGIVSYTSLSPAELKDMFEE